MSGLLATTAPPATAEAPNETITVESGNVIVPYTGDGAVYTTLSCPASHPYRMESGTTGLTAYGSEVFAITVPY
ncbi:hypothetical protein, partial [Micromonospora harpali]